VEFKESFGRKDDQDKLMYDLLDPKFEDAIVEILTHGAKKYAKDNWKKVEPFEDRYYSALRRHLAAWRKGEMIDPDSGLHHLAHCATNIYFLYMRSIENASKSA
jgi:hypothetical protein